MLKDKITEFERDLARVLNAHSVDSETNTPDFILARYITKCIYAYEAAKAENEDWHDTSPATLD